MRIVVRSEGVNLWLPIPLPLLGAAAALLPQAAVAQLRKRLPPPFQEVVTKAFLQALMRACRQTLRQYRGLELVRVEAQDGTFVSIRV